MTTLLVLIAPQRSTQYADLAAALAPVELRLSPLGGLIASIEPVEFGGQGYLKVELAAESDDGLARELGGLSMVSALYEYRERLGEFGGPWLRPMDTRFAPLLPPDVVSTRRYRGKTNEMFTHFLCNVARYSSAYAREPWTALRVLDPLAGGGTTLLMAMVLGADAAGVEERARDVQTTAGFLRRYAAEQGIPCQHREERLRGIGRRWWLTLGRGPETRCLLAQGDTARSRELLQGFGRPHLIVADLPYGIQHHGPLTDLLTRALPAWTELLLPGGAMALAWDATRFGRREMAEQVGGERGLRVLGGPPYDAMAHRVDRVIRRRDVMVARREEG